ncbi:MAG: TolC family protein [Planctomycetota bacterium]|nr:MAG: TolC family protein [Planctomycetota bacterium]
MIGDDAASRGRTNVSGTHRCRLLATVAALTLLSAATGTARAGDGDAPRAVTATSAARPVLALSLKEAIIRAIRNNPDADIARIDLSIAYEGIDEARGVFDPLFQAGVGGGRNRDPNFNAPLPGTNVTISGLPPGLTVNPSTQFNWNGGFGWRSPLGTDLSLRYDFQRRTTQSRFLLNPTVTPSGGINVTQPLLRGFGIDVNKAAITIARTQRDIAAAQLDSSLQELAFQVEQAYWLYRGTIEAVRVAEKALETAQKLLERTEAFARVGESTRLEVLEAQVGVVTRQEQLIRARNDRDNARDGLLRLITAPRQRRAWDVDVVLLDAPRVREERFDVRLALAQALAHRPELVALERAIEVETSQRLLAENDRLPRLDLVGGWSNTGLGSSHHNAHEALLSGRYYRWNVGLQFELPLFNTRARAAARAARERIRRAQRQRDSLEQQVVLEVRSAIRDILAARERLRTTELGIRLAEEQLEREIARRDAQLATNFEVLQREEDLTDARNAHVAAQVDYAIARARYERVRGNMLRRFSIEIAP